MRTPTDDGHLMGVARDLMVSVLETAQIEEGVTAKATDDAVAYLLLAAAELVSPIELTGHALPVSLALRQALDETLTAYAEPIVSIRDLDQLSDREPDALAARLDAEADAYQAHAGELRRFQAGQPAADEDWPA